MFVTWCCWLCPIWAAWLLTILTRHLESHTGFLRRRCWTSSPESSSSCRPPCRTTTSCGATLWRMTGTWFRTTTPARPHTRWPSPRRTARPGGCRLTGSGSASARGELFRPVSDTSGQVDRDAALNVKSREMIIFFFGGGFKDSFQTLFVIYSLGVMFESPAGGAKQHTLQNYFYRQ